MSEQTNTWIVELYYDPQQLYIGELGAFHARLRDNHSVCGMGFTEDTAVLNAIKKASQHGYPTGRGNYQVIRISDPS